MKCKCGGYLVEHINCSSDYKNPDSKCLWCSLCREFTRISLKTLAKEALNESIFCAKCKVPLEPPFIEFRQGLCGLCYQNYVVKPKQIMQAATALEVDTLRERALMNPICAKCGTRLVLPEVIFCTSCRVNSRSAGQGDNRSLDEETDLGTAELLAVEIGDEVTFDARNRRVRIEKKKEEPVFVIPEKKKRRFDL